eukprot:TRINITY_DN2305_c0_g1_i1.p1 TRINITY_DN2305_c0_g1~~TRINITY_DN2305_c0_g1_i1.p1  ORF type:complete len:419 (-),score=115.56 TRINITY_DN2305_c0_g1_i1:110-1366(-)
MSAQHESRVHRLTGQVSASTTSSASRKSPDDVVVVWSKRSAICKARRGQFKDVGAVEMLAPVFKALVEETKIDPKIIGDIVVGNVLGLGAVRATEARQAAFLAGYPDSVPIRTVNRQCSSGLQAIADVAAAIRAGFYECGVGAGVETMSKDPFGWSGSVSEEVKSNSQAANCLLPMGITSENVAAKYKISRKTQDELAVASHKKAAKAIETGRFKDEIVPIQVKWKDPATGAIKKIVVDTDDGVRGDTTFEGLSKLKAVFKKDGSTTAGNASQVSDGAAATLLMKRSLANKLGLKIIGVFRSFAAVGVPPEIMGVGPGYAIPVALQLAKLSSKDIDVFEINEAFASQAWWSVNHLGLPWEKVNPNGGAIALGHPLGMTGARMTASLLSELKKRKARYGVVSMCIGSGMGAAAVYELET